MRPGWRWISLLEPCLTCKLQAAALSFLRQASDRLRHRAHRRLARRTQRPRAGGLAKNGHRSKAVQDRAVQALDAHERGVRRGHVGAAEGAGAEGRERRAHDGLLNLGGALPAGPLRRRHTGARLARARGALTSRPRSPLSPCPSWSRAQNAIRQINNKNASGLSFEVRPCATCAPPLACEPAGMAYARADDAPAPARAPPLPRSQELYR